ncbi:hypothetical protein D9623_33635 (plasmid) [Azospirillum brasilense]|uniref:Uncharacterized protein n=1 Tax=Azospirillum brasilense TaxID=192 RepID=A0A4D8QPP2_AZOBR|nr:MULTISPECIES: hypothetical protein [Azospirillum]YP_001686877.1 hypothetical protein APCd_gp36 [Azospirillum phage Cd]MDW7555384.1 hypothetical protein [Azospirillum brasilense]MDW7595208.1 hypothetical protein [Azospirillum brasilense]MDW7630361.1 hypothetical protein [Azospirillum brasilense]MDX5949729.1 hypothetical protein [Azospirillum brasilense]OPH16860.1 hypothetical protein FE89_02570 [Azospirillum brasilense]
MRARVLKPFPYSGDGIRIEALKEGQEADIRDDLVAGLTAEGFIGPVGQVAQPVETVTAAFDPSTADAEALRTFLAERGVSVHHRTGLDKLREMAAAELAKD